MLEDPKRKPCEDGRAQEEEKRLKTLHACRAGEHIAAVPIFELIFALFFLSLLKLQGTSFFWIPAHTLFSLKFSRLDLGSAQRFFSFILRPLFCILVCIYVHLACKSDFEVRLLY